MGNPGLANHSLDTKAAVSTRLLIEHAFGQTGPRRFSVRLWNGEIMPAETAQPRFTLVLNHPGALRSMFRLPLELALGEAFIYGDFDIEGDIFAAISWMAGLARASFTPAEAWKLLMRVRALPSGNLHPAQGRPHPAQGRPHPAQGRGPARLKGRPHSRARDRAAITYHYDVGNDFYRLWLDRRMTYSCAYFITGEEDLDTAQQQKYEHICRKLRLQPGERLLDIGCGWGGLVLYAAQNYGVQAVGVTLSARQSEYAARQIAAAGMSGRAEVRLQDYRDLADESFDKIVSVGMFEHVGREHLPEYFEHTRRLLRPGGLFLNHGISRRPPEAAGRARALVERRILGSNAFIQRYVFPDGELVPLSEVNLYAERAGFEVRDVENLREHYALTLRHWVRRLEARWQEAVQVSDEVTARIWRLYMAASAYGFDAGNINVNQTLLHKAVPGRRFLPWTRADIYAGNQAVAVLSKS